MHKFFTGGRTYMGEAANVMEPLLARGPTVPGTTAEVLRGIARATVRRLRVAATLMYPDSIGEAAVLARTLIEGAVSCAYIGAPKSAAERDERAERYRAFEIIHRQMNIEGLSQLVGKPLPARLEKERDALAQARDAATQRFAGLDKHFMGWTGKKWGHVKKDITVTNPGWPIAVLLEDYAHFSAFVHATALSVSVSLSDAGDTRELLAFDVASSSGLSAVLSCTTVAAFSSCRAPDMAGLLRRFEELMA